jgi:hypothetical protein
MANQLKLKFSLLAQNPIPCLGDLRFAKRMVSQFTKDRNIPMGGSYKQYGLIPHYWVHRKLNAHQISKLGIFHRL